MFEDIRKEMRDNWVNLSALALALITVVILILIVGFKSQEMQPIESRDKTNGVTCYTFNTSISCVQVER